MPGHVIQTHKAKVFDRLSRQGRHGNWNLEQQFLSLACRYDDFVNRRVIGRGPLHRGLDRQAATEQKAPKDQATNPG